VRPEGLGKLKKNLVTLSGIEPATFRLVAFFLFIWFFETVGTEATPGLLCQLRVIVKMIVEKQMDCRLAGETEVL
jgi:hypothetical protein